MPDPLKHTHDKHFIIAVHTKQRSIFTSVLYLLTCMIITLALTSGVLLLFFDTPQKLLQHVAHAPFSAAPLLLIGIGSLCFQYLIQPRPLELLRALIVSSAFILWGIDQLLAASWLATTLGDVVIVLYVIDLSWMMIERLKKLKTRER